MINPLKDKDGNYIPLNTSELTRMTEQFSILPDSAIFRDSAYGLFRQRKMIAYHTRRANFT